ncbi:hypothetical protein [Microbacterium sp. gxy059]|uniref:hypothetical protein n=1 Tax=Microbacterium sp. gxy059 TaxID=2957199 RepID=UPI003D977B8D
MTATALPDLALRLPGSWWDVPLGDRDEARASVRRLLRTRLGTSDERARGRIELERRLMASLDQAIEGDGRSLQIALSIVPGARISMTAMIATPELAIPHQPDPSLTPLDVLALALERARGADEAPAAKVPSRAGTALRRVRYRVTTADGSEETLRTAAFEYWFVAPGTRRAVVATFSVPAGALEDELGGLADAIVAVSGWQEPAAA